MKTRALVPVIALHAMLTVSPSARSQGEIWTKDCKVTEVAAVFGRVHVRCGWGPAHVGDIYYFAAPTSASAEAARLVALGTTALTSGANLRIRYDWNYTDAASFGCALHDCRRALELWLTK